MKDGVSATVWIKKSNNKFDGIVIQNNGHIPSLGNDLLTNLNSTLLVHKFILNGSIISFNDQTKLEDVEEMLDVGASTMKIYSKRWLDGAYIYIFNEATNEWYFGTGEKPKTLSSILEMLKPKNINKVKV